MSDGDLAVILDRPVGRRVCSWCTADMGPCVMPGRGDTNGICDHCLIVHFPKSRAALEARKRIEPSPWLCTCGHHKDDYHWHGTGQCIRRDCGCPAYQPQLLGASA